MGGVAPPYGGATGYAPPPPPTTAQMAPPPTADEVQRSRNVDNTYGQTQQFGGDNFSGQHGSGTQGATAAFQHGVKPGSHPTYQHPAATAVDYGGRQHQMSEAQMDRFLEDAQTYNSGPHFVAPTMKRPPQTASLKFKAPLPLGICIQPLASVPVGYPEVPVVNFGAVGTVIRCKRCRTYINPFIQWEANGRRWICNLCGFASETPNAYYCNLDETGKRVDSQERPELSSGTVEYIAPGEYMVRPPQPPVFLFLIDVSANSAQSGFLQTAVQSIQEVLESDSMPNGDQRLQVGIITYDSSVQFYKLNPNMSTPQMLVVADLDDLFLPLPDDVLVNATECQSAISTLLESLPTIFQESKNTEACLGPAIKAAYLAMKHVGGKLVIFSASMPTIGELHLSVSRENSRKLGTDQESELLRPASEAYKDLAAELVRVQISAEIFVATPQFYDLSSLAPLAKFTGGDLNYYQMFRSDLHSEKLSQDIKRILTRYTGWEAVMRVRVSRGWKITNFFGHLYVRGVDLLVVPNCNADQTFSVTIDMEENVTPDPVLYIQAALLYTNSDGERRIRVHTYSCPSTQNFQEMINSLDSSAVVSIVTNLAMKQCLATTMAEGRSIIQTTAQQVVNAQNQCPDAVPFLPLYLLGLLKSIAFRAGTDVVPDVRIAHWTRLESLSVILCVAYCYPRMIGLHDLGTDPLEMDDYGRFVLPTMLNLTSESMSQEGIYLLEDGVDINLWCGRTMNPSVMQSMLGVSNLEELEVDYVDHVLQKNAASPVAAKVISVINAIRAERVPAAMRILCFRQGDAQEARFFTFLYEDRVGGCPQTYQEFLQRMGSRPAQAAQAVMASAPPRAY
eukprot:GEMP01006545.1.p1 GENE.GEMP01006545.1~~GEMP01006545.1.p1  ORF type:complete len:981 (+),score=148.58 GEMP01006545.1:401-2944(+)